MAIIEAEPYAFDLDPARAGLVIIDMQRDFLEPGGFGAALGNDVSLLRRTIAPTRRLLEGLAEPGLASSTLGRAIAPILQTCRLPRKRAAGSPRVSATQVLWAGSWFAESPDTTSSPNSTLCQASRSSTSRARAHFTRPTSRRC